MSFTPEKLSAERLGEMHGSTENDDMGSLKMPAATSGGRAKVSKSVAVKTVTTPPKTAQKLKKAPDAPRRFKSAFIFFSAEKHKEIRAQLGDKTISAKTADISKLVSAAWKELSDVEKSKWETMSRNDRTRYDFEKSLYKGPWQIPNKRKKKDVNAPKRPMSAFLAFANSRRADVKRKMQDASNGDVSKALAAMWKDAPEDVRHRYIKEEFEKRQDYKAVMSEWKEMNDEKERVERQQQKELIEASMRLAQQVGTATEEDQERSLRMADTRDGVYNEDGATSIQMAGQTYFGLSPGFQPYASSNAPTGSNFLRDATLSCEGQQNYNTDETTNHWMTGGQRQPMHSFYYPDHAFSFYSQSSVPQTNNAALTNDGRNFLQSTLPSYSVAPAQPNTLLETHLDAGFNPFGYGNFSGSLSQGVALPGERYAQPNSLLEMMQLDGGSNSFALGNFSGNFSQGLALPSQHPRDDSAPLYHPADYQAITQYQDPLLAYGTRTTNSWIGNNADSQEPSSQPRTDQYQHHSHEHAYDPSFGDFSNNANFGGGI